MNQGEGVRKGKKEKKRKEGRREDFLLEEPGGKERREREREKKKKTAILKKRRKMGKGRVYKVGFWNVAGLENKDQEFWKKLRKWNVIFLSKTWLQRKEWERIKRYKEMFAYE